MEAVYLDEFDARPWWDRHRRDSVYSGLYPSGQVSPLIHRLFYSDSELVW